jgi:hypothetical protein
MKSAVFRAHPEKRPLPVYSSRELTMFSLLLFGMHGDIPS